MIGAAVHDPERHFTTVNCRSAKGLFDHLVGACEYAWRNGEAERLRGLGVDRQFVLGRRLHWHEMLGD